MNTVNIVHERGPFDIIGDVHGCFDELKSLLEKLGYQLKKHYKYSITHPDNRKIIFVGDLVDRGSNSVEVLRLVMNLMDNKAALCVAGNHDDKLRRYLMGNDVLVDDALQTTITELEKEPTEFKTDIMLFLLDIMPGHLLLDDGKLVVVHGGIMEEHIGNESRDIKSFCMWARPPKWVMEYKGKAKIVYGHTPIDKPEWENNTINIDTGCVYGGELTALRYPEMELVAVKANKVYWV